MSLGEPKFTVVTHLCCREGSHPDSVWGIAFLCAGWRLPVCTGFYPPGFAE